jgi:hypothetical protein
LLSILEVESEVANSSSRLTFEGLVCAVDSTGFVPVIDSDVCHVYCNGLETGWRLVVSMEIEKDWIFQIQQTIQPSLLIHGNQERFTSSSGRCRKGFHRYQYWLFTSNSEFFITDDNLDVALVLMGRSTALKFNGWFVIMIYFAR